MCDEEFEIRIFRSSIFFKTTVKTFRESFSKHLSSRLLFETTYSTSTKSCSSSIKLSWRLFTSKTTSIKNVIAMKMSSTWYEIVFFLKSSTSDYSRKSSKKNILTINEISEFLMNSQNEFDQTHSDDYINDINNETFSNHESKNV